VVDSFPTGEGCAAIPPPGINCDDFDWAHTLEQNNSPAGSCIWSAEVAAVAPRGAGSIDLRCEVISGISYWMIAFRSSSGDTCSRWRRINYNGCPSIGVYTYYDGNVCKTGNVTLGA
jgi:hypothetical protein